MKPNKCYFKGKTITKTQLVNFDFRFIRHVTRGLYEIIDGKEWKKDFNASKPHFISNDHMAFWDDTCDCHANVIYFKDILPM